MESDQSSESSTMVDKIAIARLDCRQTNNMQASDHKEDHKPFERNLSMPASFKLQQTSVTDSLQDNNNNDQNNNGYNKTIESSSENKPTRTLQPIKQNEHRRESPSERSYSSLRNSSKNRKELQPSSQSSGSNASDSAFSQSQTTLGSDTSESSCFKAPNNKRNNNNNNNKLTAMDGSANNKQKIRINKDSKQFRSNIKMAAHDTSKTMQFADYDEGDDEDDDVGEDDDDDDDGDSHGNSGTLGATVGDQFKLIWRNLTYQIPEKRFTRLMGSVRRQRDRFWPPSCATSGDGSVNSSEAGLQVRAEPDCATKRVIFENLNGCAKSGELSAILGPSGAGKTTLLKCLTNRVYRGVSGSIDIEETCEKTSRRLKLCIIPQKGESQR